MGVDRPETESQVNWLGLKFPDQKQGSWDILSENRKATVCIAKECD